MSTEPTTENRETGTHDRSPLTWLVAAAAAVIIAGVGLFAVLQLNGDSDTPVATTPAATEPTVTHLSAPDAAAYAAKCMVPNADIVSQQALAFDGVVTTIADGVVTLTPSHWYAGDPTDLVRVQAPSDEMQELVSAVELEDGGRYLVSASGGQVTVCGFSAPYSADLAAIYDEAFPG